MTKSNKGFFQQSSGGDLTLRLMIRSDQFSTLSEILTMSTLSAFQEYPIKTEEVMVMT